MRLRVISQDIALLLELIGVNLATGESLLENPLSFRARVRTRTPRPTPRGTLAQVIVAVREGVDQPNDDQYEEGEKEYEKDTPGYSGSSLETVVMKSIWWHDVTSLSSYSRSRRVRDERDGLHVTIG